MQGKCHKCGDQEFRVESDKVFRLGVPWLTSLLMREVKYACTNCGDVRQTSTRLFDLGNHRLPLSLGSPRNNDLVERKIASVGRFFSDKYLMVVQYPAAFRAGENVLQPTFEGNVQDATVVDRYGKPDLMADFAEEYLRQFGVLMPAGRLPSGLTELMPALLLLVTATELAVKAYLIRDGKSLKPSHSLVDLYRELDLEHRREVERRFTSLESSSALLALGLDAPKVVDILQAYSQTYGGGSSVYMDARYYAEPTTMYPPSSTMHGANLSKGLTPYPIFLPDVVRGLIDTYRSLSGPERLRRLGADLQGNFRDSGNDNHGEWGLIPSSLDLVVISVPQRAGKDAKDKDLRVFRSFKKSHPTDFTADWMYGGNTLLFYRDNGQWFSDGSQVVDGLECRVLSNARLGLHSRDLYLLADALDCASKGEDRFGQFTAPEVEEKWTK